MRKFTLFMMSLFLMLGTAMAQSYSLTETRLSSGELNAKTAPTLIAIKNLSKTNNYYFVGNTGAVPYSAADFSDAAVFVWQPVQEGVAGSYYLMKLDGTYMQATSPKDFGTVDGAAVFTTTNPTTTGTESTNFNGDGDSQGYIDDEALLVRFVNAAGTWINVQNGDGGTPLYNSGKGGWTIHHVYAVEEAAVEPEPEPTSRLVLELTSEQIGTAPYQLSDEDAAKVFALSDMTVALKVTTPASMNNIRCALFCTSDPTQAANTDAKGTNSAYVAYGTSNQNIGYLASCKTGDRFTSGTIPLATEDVVLVYVISPTNNLFQLYMNGSLIKEWNNAHSDGFMSGYEIATPQMVKADYENANIYIGGGMTAEGTYEVFPGTITGVEVHNGVLSAEEIADIFATTEPEPETPFEVVAVTPSEAVAELSTVTVEFSEEIEGTFDMMGMTQIYLGTKDKGCSFEVNGKVLTITPFNAINTPGEYKLVIPEGLITRKSNGEAVTMNGEYVFTVKEAEAPFEVVAVTPTEAVEELTTVTVEFSEEIEGTFDMMGMTQIYLGTKDKGCSFEVNGKVLTITPFNAINTPGEYKLVIPEGLITRKSNGEAVTMNGEYVFTVKEATVEPEPEAIPAANKSYTVVAEGHTTVSRPQWAINDEGTAFVSTGNTTVSTDAQKLFAFVTYEEAIYIYSISAKKFVMKDASLSDKNPDAVQLTELENGKFFFKFDADHNVNIGGSGQMTIDWWSTIDGGNQFTLTEAGDFDATEALALLNKTPEPEAPLKVVAVTPAEDEVVNSLREITIEFDAEIAVKELSGTERISIDYGWGVLIGTTATVEGKLLKLVADTEIKDNGTYPLTIPAGVVTRVSDGVAYEGGTFTFTVEKAAVVVEPLTVVAVTPTESVEKLETITIEFSDNVDVPATASGKFTIADADGNNVATLYAWDAAVDGKVVTLTLTEAITTAGEYTFSFAEGLVTRQGDGATCAYTCTINVTGVVGIDSIYGEAGESVIYDITGRKIEKITEGGIYIINGKKVLVK